MKPGAIVLNVARGGIVDEAAVADGAARRPPRRRRDRRLRARAADRLAAARRAEHAAHAAPRRVDGRGPGRSSPRRSPTQVLDVLDGRSARYAVNAPLLTPETARAIAPYLPLAEILGRFFAQFARGGVRTLTLEIAGELAEYDGVAADRRRPARPARDRRRPSGSTSSTPAPSPRRAGSRSSSARRPTPARSPRSSRCRARAGGRTTTVAGTVAGGEPRHHPARRLPARHGAGRRDAHHPPHGPARDGRADRADARRGRRQHQRDAPRPDARRARTP